ncbi:MAG: type II/IV secretion system protein, partial [Pirellulales bacterium]
MSTSMGSFSDILVRQGVISLDQLSEADVMSRDTATSVADALVRLGYATGDEVMRAVAEEHHLDFVNLDEVTIPPGVVELVPESVARENVILPMSDEGDSLRVIVSNPLDLDTFDKLRFILNRKIDIAVAPRETILQAI